jgi:hypothetical protein
MPETQTNRRERHIRPERRIKISELTDYGRSSRVEVRRDTIGKDELKWDY